MLEPETGEIVAVTWQEGGRLLKQMCHASVPQYGPPDEDDTPVIVAFGYLKDRRLVQLACACTAGAAKATAAQSIALAAISRQPGMLQQGINPSNRAIGRLPQLQVMREP